MGTGEKVEAKPKKEARKEESISGWSILFTFYFAMVAQGYRRGEENTEILMLIGGAAMLFVWMCRSAWADFWSKRRNKQAQK